MYPLAAGENERVFVEAHLSEVLEHAKATPDLGMDHVFLWLSNRVAQESLVEYVETALHLGNQGQKWADFTKQFRAIKTLGSSDPFLRALFDRHVAVFALSARDRLANWDKHLKFPDLSVREVRPEGIEELLSKPEGAKDFVVLIAGASSSSDRHVISQTDLDSKFVSGHHFEPNPDYDIAVANVNIARDNFRQAQDQYNQQMSQNNNSGGNGLSALGAGLNGFAAGLALGNARNRLQDAYNNLQRTPRQLQMLDFSEYSYSTSEIRASKDIVYMVYIINRSQSEMIKVSRKNNLPADFSLVYNLNKKDQSFDRIRAAHKEESDIDAFEKEPYPVLMASLLEVADGLESIERPKLVMELQSVAEGVPSSKLKVNTSKIAAMVQDERFESVVVVQNPRGGLGAGFYVAPNLIITNQHVVAGSSFPEIKLRSGVTCVGKVVKTDIGLDLALIKVSKSGKPLELLEDNFEVGTSVDAIGHPAGLTYTLTRGVISAVRYIHNPLVPGSSKMLVIQTDAAINPGNSGGPLMRGEKVIGINSQKLSAKGIEGLGFALHATEIKQFLGETN